MYSSHGTTHDQESSSLEQVHEDRNKTRRLADIKRGNKTLRRFQLLADQYGESGMLSADVTASTRHHNGKAISLSATEKRRANQRSPGKQGRHSCPTLPGISSSTNFHCFESNENSVMEGNIQKEIMSKDWTDIAPNVIPQKQQTQNEPLSAVPCNDNQNKSDIDFFLSVTSDKLTSDHEDEIRSFQFTKIDSVSMLPKKEYDIKKSERSVTKQNIVPSDCVQRSSSTPALVPTITVNSHLDNVSASSHEPSTRNKQLNIDTNDSMTLTRRQYSVLLNGGTLTKQAPYTAERQTVSKNEQLRPGGDPSREQMATAPRRPNNPPSLARKHRHLRDDRDVFDFQRDLLLPRYKKLAGIVGDHRHHNQRREHHRDCSGGGSHNQGNKDHQDLSPVGEPDTISQHHAREVFERVRVLIHGPDKVTKENKGGTDGAKNKQKKLLQPDPICLQSGLPCGYVDSSSKCDAWLDANDFDDSSH